MNIVVAGTGYVGLVTGACLSEVGHNVTCVDIDRQKVELMKQGISPIYEPGLDELLERNYKENRLNFTVDYKNAYKNADIVFIGVGTPERVDGSANLDYVFAVCKQIAENVTNDCLVVVKSTVPIGTNDKVEEFLKEKGYRVMLGNIGENHQSEHDYLKVLLQSNAAGIISTHDFKEEFPDLDIPSVIVDRVGHKSNYGVFSDNESGGRLAAKVIVEAGAKNVAVVSGSLNATNINNRFKASIAYLKEKKVDFKAFYSQSYDFEEIQKEAREVLANKENFDSIIAPSDIHAMAYIHEIHRLDKKIPEEIQIIGYDDIQMSQFIYPALSTIHQSAYQMGLEAAQLIYKIATDQPIEKSKIELPVHYVARETIRQKRKE